MKKGIPERGDILHIDLEPTRGREQRGKRYVVVLTTLPFNRLGLALVAPITQGGQFAREHGFGVSLQGIAAVTQGIVLCQQLRVLDHRERDAKWVESLPEYIVEEILARVRTLLD